MCAPLTSNSQSYTDIHIVNMSISSGCIPSPIKDVIVTPLPKKTSDMVRRIFE